jgi:hypothetical protein
VQKFNEQYPPIELRKFSLAHDRFIIIDETELYHLGVSLKPGFPENYTNGENKINLYDEITVDRLLGIGI